MMDRKEGTWGTVLEGEGAGDLFCGVDVGSCAIKVVLLDHEGQARSRVTRPSGVDYEATFRACLVEALGLSGGGSVAKMVSTGHGRRNVAQADEFLTEILCHGVGCYHSVRGAITIVDIGGQDNKIICLDEEGRRVDFTMNRKCAAGTGAFIEEIALRLSLDIGQLEPMAAGTTEAVTLNSFCTVFAKTEILSHLRKGTPVASIVRGAFASVIARIVEMGPLEGEVMLTGGVVAHNPTMAVMLSQRLGREVRVPPYPQFTGALGAALEAWRGRRD